MTHTNDEAERAAREVLADQYKNPSIAEAIRTGTEPGQWAAAPIAAMIAFAKQEGEKASTGREASDLARVKETPLEARNRIADVLGIDTDFDNYTFSIKRGTLRKILTLSATPKSGEVAIPEGTKAWHGGDSAPADWDGGEVLLRDGTVIDRGDGAAKWLHASSGSSMSRSDCIAYTPRPATARPDVVVEALEKISDGAALGTLMFEEAIKGKRSLTWRAVNILQDNLAACKDTARNALFALKGER